MSTTAALSGLGAGIMTGLQFMQNKRNQNAQMARQDELLGMQRQQQEWKQADVERTQRDQKRLDDWNTMSTQIAKDNPGDDPYTLTKKQMQAGIDNNLLDFNQLSALRATANQLEGVADRKTFNDAILTGNTQALQDSMARKFGRQMGAITVSKSTTPGSRYTFNVDQGGGKVMSLPDTHLAAMFGAKDYLDSMEAEQKARKTDSEISKNNALELAAIGRSNYSNAKADQIESGATGTGRGSGGTGGRKGKPGLGEALPFDTGDYEKYARIDPNTQKPDPSSMAAIGSVSENIFQNNPSLRASPQQIVRIAGMVDRGDLKPDDLYDSATNTYRQGVKFGDAKVFLGASSNTNPLLGMDGKPVSPERQQQILATDKAWSERVMGALPQDQRSAMESAMVGTSPEGLAARQQITSAYQKFQESGMPIPPELEQKYRLLMTSDRMRSVPQAKGPSGSSQDGKKVMSEGDRATAQALGIDPDQETPWQSTKRSIGSLIGSFSGLGAKHDQAEFDRLLKAVQERPDDAAARRYLFKRALGNPERQARIQEVLGNTQLASDR